MEFNFGYIRSFAIQNSFSGTPLTYEDFGEYSGVNLKCKAKNGVFFNIQSNFPKSKFFYCLGFEKTWFKYTTTQYQKNYSNESTTSNYKESYSLTTELNNLKIGIGRNINLNKSRFSFDIYGSLVYRMFRDKEIVAQKNEQNVNSLIITDDFFFKTTLDFSAYDRKMVPQLVIRLNYNLNEKVGLSFLYQITTGIQGDYLYYRGDYKKSFIETPDGIVSITQISAGHKNDFRLLVSSIDFGLSLNYRF